MWPVLTFFFPIIYFLCVSFLNNEANYSQRWWWQKAWSSLQCPAATRVHHLAFVRARAQCMSQGSGPLACLASSSGWSDVRGHRQPNPNLQRTFDREVLLSHGSLCHWWICAAWSHRGVYCLSKGLMQPHLCQMGRQNAWSGHLNAQITFVCKSSSK